VADEQQRIFVLLDHLERRRNTFDQSMWQAPGLTIAAQAFLLTVLTDSGISTTARACILAAGISAVSAAILSLLRLRAREVEYSEPIAYYAKAAGIDDPRNIYQGRRISLEKHGPSYGLTDSCGAGRVGISDRS
jgi:hypothetical protein